MARQQIVNRTWAPVSERVAGGSVTSFYVNLRHAAGLAVLRHGGSYALGAVFDLRRSETGRVDVIPLDLPAGTSQGDADRALVELIAVVGDSAD